MFRVSSDADERTSHVDVTPPFLHSCFKPHYSYRQYASFIDMAILCNLYWIPARAPRIKLCLSIPQLARHHTVVGQ